MSAKYLMGACKSIAVNKHCAAIVIALLLVSPSFASTLDEFVFARLQNGETFTTEEFGWNGTNATVVFVGSDMAMLVNKSASRYSLLNSTEAVRPFLVSYYASKNITPALYSNLSQVLPHMLAFNASRNESDCDKLTGMDVRECYDRESCQKSCYAITSFCQTIAIGSGWYLIDSMLEFNNDTAQMDNLSGQFAPVFTEAAERPSLESIDCALGLVVETNILASKLRQNPLYSAFEICPQAMSFYDLREAKSILTDTRSAALPLLVVDNTTAYLVSGAAERDELASHRSQPVGMVNVTNSSNAPGPNSTANPGGNETQGPNLTNPQGSGAQQQSAGADYIQIIAGGMAIIGVALLAAAAIVFKRKRGF